MQLALEAAYHPSRALSVHADYPDAHWHVADILVQLGRPDEAAAHWRKYLEFDHRGPWAESGSAAVGRPMGDVPMRRKPRGASRPAPSV